MLSFERRSTVARSLSVAGNPAWMVARAVRPLASNKASINANQAKAAIRDQAQLGFITGRAVLAQRFDGPTLGTEPSWEGHEWDIPHWFWQGSTMKAQSSQDWEQGRFHAEGTGPNGDCLMRLSGVYFLTDSLQILLPAIGDTSSERSVKAKVGGRPPQPWRDDLWCAVWA